MRRLLASGRVRVNGVVEFSFSRRIGPDFAVVVDDAENATTCMAKDHDSNTACTDKDSNTTCMDRDCHDAPYLLVYHKPCGVVTSLDDEQGRTDLSTIRQPWASLGR